MHKMRRRSRFAANNYLTRRDELSSSSSENDSAKPSGDGMSCDSAPAERAIAEDICDGMSCVSAPAERAIAEDICNADDEDDVLDASGEFSDINPMNLSLTSRIGVQVHECNAEEEYFPLLALSDQSCGSTPDTETTEGSSQSPPPGSDDNVCVIQTTSEEENNEHQPPQEEHGAARELSPLERRYLTMTCHCTMSLSAMEKCWDFFQNYYDEIRRGIREHGKSAFITLRRRNSKTLPPIWIDYHAELPDGSPNAGGLLVVERAQSLNLKHHGVTMDGVRVVVGYVRVADVVKFHENIHSEAGLGCNIKQVHLAIDGISESKSTSISLVVFAIRFLDCRNVYPIAITRPSHGYKFDREKTLEMVIKDLNDNGITVIKCIADTPERKKLKKLKAMNGFHGCDICVARGASIYCKTGESVPRGKNKRKNKGGGGATVRVIAHPKKFGQCATLRKNASFKRLGELWNSWTLKERTDNVDKLQGIQGLTLLHTLAGPPDVIEFCPPEYMHFLCLGVAKTLIELTFEVTSSKKLRRRPRMKLAPLDKLLKSIKLPSEMARRTRPMDLSSWKADELKVFSLFCAVIAIKFQQQDVNKKLWAYFVFLVRAYLLPNAEYEQIPKIVLKKANHNFLRLLQGTFSRRMFTSNTHTFAHLEIIRQYVGGPLTQASAFPYESHFGKIRAAIVVGTPNTVKQILTTIYTAYKAGNHRCENKMEISVHRTSRTSDREFYLWTEADGYHFYQVVEQPRDPDIVIAKRIMTETSVLSPFVQWDLVGVHQIRQDQTDPDPSGRHTIRKSQIDGKAVIVLDQILCVPRNVLLE
jgi:hypothetical protein